MKKKIIVFMFAAMMTASCAACGSKAASSGKVEHAVSAKAAESISVVETEESEVQEVTEDAANGDTSMTDTQETVTNDDKEAGNDSNDNGTTESNNGNSDRSSSRNNTGNRDNTTNQNIDNGGNTSSNAGSNTSLNNPPAQGNNDTAPAETHTHNYVEVSRTNPTCTADGVVTYQCSCGAVKTESNGGALGHHMVHHDAVTHTENQVVSDAYDEPVYESRYICNGCGAQFETDDEALDHTMIDFFDNCENYYCDEVQVGTNHHDAVYEIVTVTDTPAYDECDRCGARN